jgi:hypothetical protein
VVPIAEHISFATGDTVNGSSQADRDSDKTSRKRGLVVCFDDEVNVIALNRKVHDAKPLA